MQMAPNAMRNMVQTNEDNTSVRSVLELEFLFLVSRSQIKKEQFDIKTACKR